MRLPPRIDYQLVAELVHRIGVPRPDLPALSTKNQWFGAKAIRVEVKRGQ